MSENIDKMESGFSHWKITGALPDPVTCITVYKDRVFLASGQRVYELVDGVWHPMVFVVG